MALTIENNNFYINQGDTGSFSVVFTRDFVEGDVVSFTIADLNINKEVITFTDGKAIISLTATDTGNEIGTYAYKLKIETFDNQVLTVLPQNPCDSVVFRIV